MPDFGVLYAMLFETVTKAVEEMDKMNFGRARELLAAERERGLNACFSSGEYKDLSDPYHTPGMIVELERRKRRAVEKSGRQDEERPR